MVCNDHEGFLFQGSPALNLSRGTGIHVKHVRPVTLEALAHKENCFAFRGVLPKKMGGMCGPRPKTPTLFKTKS